MNMKFFEMRLWVRIFCGVCGRTASRYILYVERNQERFVVIGCQKCRVPILLIRLFPQPEFTFIAENPLTKIDLDDFSFRERTF